jgi:hypothetical protein
MQRIGEATRETWGEAVLTPARFPVCEVPQLAARARACHEGNHSSSKRRLSPLESERSFSIGVLCPSDPAFLLFFLRVAAWEKTFL